VVAANRVLRRVVARHGAERNGEQLFEDLLDSSLFGLSLARRRSGLSWVLSPPMRHRDDGRVQRFLERSRPQLPPAEVTSSASPTW